MKNKKVHFRLSLFDNYSSVIISRSATYISDYFVMLFLLMNLSTSLIIENL